MKFIIPILFILFPKVLLAQNLSDKSIENPVSDIGNIQRNNWKAPNTPKKANLFSEPVPLDRWEVYERLDRELLTNSFYHTATFYILKLKNRYENQILNVLKEENVPTDFLYLCIAESSLQNLKSPAGAEGFWQFLSATAKSYGLEVNEHIDERYHVEKSTRAACKYLKEAKTKFGTWTAAAASYNCGMGGYNSFATSQGSNQYYDLLLPEETNRYIFRILALKLILENPVSYGFNIQENQLYKPIKTKKITVNTSINDLILWSQSQGTTYKIVRLLNPWIKGKLIPNKSGKTYVIEIPA